MRVIGVDPGYDRLGIAILETERGKNVLIFSDCLTTEKTMPVSERIFSLGGRIQELVKRWRPGAMAIEKLFFTKNQKTAMGVAEARGAIINIARTAGLKIFEYTPLQIKIAVTGYGKATKDQVVYMLGQLLKIDKKDGPRLDDEFDAMAAALTCLVSEKNYPQP